MSRAKSDTTELSVVHDTLVLQRTYKASPQRVFAAWADPQQKRRWFAEGEHWTVNTFEVDFRVGGFERSTFQVKDGPSMRNDTVYFDIIEARRIVCSYSMSMGEQPFSVSLATVELAPAGTGTRLTFTEQAAFFEGADGAEQRKQGWSVLLGRLEAELDRAV